MTKNPVVNAISKINFKGNVTPKAWFKNLVNEKGKPNLKAITLLSEIVYWYRAKEERSETSTTIKYSVRFNADTLQMSYKKIEDDFGFTKEEARAAFEFLEEKNLVKREFRTIVLNGKPRANVMFVEPNPTAIENITFPLTTPVKKPTVLNGGSSENSNYRGHRKIPTRGSSENSNYHSTESTSCTESTVRCTEKKKKKSVAPKTKIEEQVLNTIKTEIKNSSSSFQVGESIYSEKNQNSLIALINSYGSLDIIRAIPEIKKLPKFEHWSIGGIIQFIPDLVKKEKITQSPGNNLLTKRKQGEFDGNDHSSMIDYY